MTQSGVVLSLEQQNDIAHSKASACKAGDKELDPSQKERHLWLAIRRGLFIMIQAIEERYDMPKTKVGG